MKPLESVSRETQERLELYLDLLKKWQAKINLVSPATLPDSWNRHIVDSAQIATLIPDGIKTLSDFGSGAGFPGLVIAIMRPEIAVTLVESDSKKCAFLQTVSRETNSPVKVDNRRIEAAVKDGSAPDVVTARALANLSDLLDYCAPWIAQNPALTMVFPKGAQAAQEVEIARKKWRFDLSETTSSTESEARILTISNASTAL